MGEVLPFVEEPSCPVVALTLSSFPFREADRDVIAMLRVASGVVRVEKSFTNNERGHERGHWYKIP